MGYCYRAALSTPLTNYTGRCSKRVKGAPPGDVSPGTPPSASVLCSFCTRWGRRSRGVPTRMPGFRGRTLGDGLTLAGAVGSPGPTVGTNIIFVPLEGINQIGFKLTKKEAAGGLASRCGRSMHLRFSYSSCSIGGHLHRVHLVLWPAAKEHVQWGDISRLLEISHWIVSYLENREVRK